MRLVFHLSTQWDYSSRVLFTGQEIMCSFQLLRSWPPPLALENLAWHSEGSLSQGNGCNSRSELELKLPFLQLPAHLLCQEKVGKGPQCCFLQLCRPRGWPSETSDIPRASLEAARTLRPWFALCHRRHVHRQANLSAQTWLPIKLVSFAASTRSGTQDTFTHPAGRDFFAIPHA